MKDIHEQSVNIIIIVNGTLHEGFFGVFNPSIIVLCKLFVNGN